MWSVERWPPQGGWTDEQIKRSAYFQVHDLETLGELAPFLPPDRKGKAIKANWANKSREPADELTKDMIGYLWVKYFGRTGAAEVPVWAEVEVPKPIVDFATDPLPKPQSIMGLGLTAIATLLGVALLTRR